MVIDDTDRPSIAGEGPEHEPGVPDSRPIEVRPERLAIPHPRRRALVTVEMALALQRVGR
jgi:hypothetical protein